ncbi:MAG TPA: ROK family protein [Ohtaekwangia sp.]
MTDSIVLGVDIGGSHITAGLVEMETRTILTDSIKRRKVNSADSAENIIATWSGLIKEVTSSNVNTRIGIAMPGPFDYELGISYIKGLEKYESLYGRNVKSLVAEALGIPANHIRLKNDAGCFLQGEIFAGSARGYKRSIGLTIGTGIGTASAKDNMADDAALWKTPMHGDIAENFLSTRWFVKRYNQLTGKEIRDVKQLCELLETNPSLHTIFNEFAVNLADFLAFFIHQENPEVIVIGGNISNASDLFLPAVQANLAKVSLSIPIKKSNLGEHAVLLGSAALWNEQLQPVK